MNKPATIGPGRKGLRSAAREPGSEAVAEAVSVAGEIVRSLRPGRVFVPREGTALARALEDRGVAVGAEPAAGYDLAVWLDVAEEDGSRLAVIAAAAPRLLFSPLSEEKPRSASLLSWLHRFADHGLAPQPAFDASFAAPHAILLERRAAVGPDEPAIQTSVELVRLRLALSGLQHDHRIVSEKLQSVIIRHREAGASTRAEIAHLHERRHEAEVARAAAERALQSVQTSAFWRATGPARRLLTAMPWLRTLLSTGLKLVWWTVSFQWPARLKARRDYLAARQVAAVRELELAPLASAPEAVRPQGEPASRSAPVDVIVCVHNALEDASRCLSSVVANTLPPYRLIVVDDGSAEPTRDYLAAFARAQAATLIRNEQARGYTFAANQGMREAQSPWLVLLNSDTVVTMGWLDRMIEQGVRDPRVGAIGPVSNTASWQSVPALLVDGDWADNPLPAGFDVARMGRTVARASARQGVPLPFLNGFCLALRRSMLDEIGLFDEETFGAGYGEENDLCIRARDADWKLVVAEDVYVFHAQSKSYSHERRLELAARADKALAAKHDWASKIGGQVGFCRFNPALTALRARVAAGIERERLIRAGQARWWGSRIVFVLPVVEEGGGGNVIVQEIRALRRMGVDCWIVNLAPWREKFERAYPELRGQVIYAESEDEIAAVLSDPAVQFDAMIATFCLSVYWLPERGVRTAYYIQDYEPLFFDRRDARYAEAVASYRALEAMTLVTKSVWNADEVAAGGAARPEVLGPSVDIDLFRPLPAPKRPPDAPVRVCAMVRPSTPRRGPRRTVETLNALKRKFGDRVEVVAFGCTDEEMERHGLKLEGGSNLGPLSRARVAGLLERSDLFLDLSDYQAMGLTALEAMASGCAAVLPLSGGARDFARDQVNALVVDTASSDACLAAAERLVSDDELRERLRLRAIEDACLYPPEASAFKLMEAIFGSEGRGRAASPSAS